jgi:predicted transposase YbfD/YdcC
MEQIALAEGENEISAGNRLLRKVDLAGKIISGDAIFAQQELSQIVVEKGGEYLWKLRGNQGTMYQMAQAHFAAGEDKYLAQTVDYDKGHGRIEQRILETSFRLAGKMEFPYLEQVFRMRKTSFEVKTGKQSEQTIYGITSLPVEEFSGQELLYQVA